MNTRALSGAVAALALAAAARAQTGANPYGGLVPPGISTNTSGGGLPTNDPVAPSTGPVGAPPVFTPGSAPPGSLNVPGGGATQPQPGVPPGTPPGGAQFQQPSGPQYQAPTAPIQPTGQPGSPNPPTPAAAPTPSAPPTQSLAPVRPPVADTPRTIGEVDSALRALERERSARKLAVKAEFEERRARLSDSEDWAVATGAERKARLKALKREALEREKRLDEEADGLKTRLLEVRQELERRIGGKP